MVDSVAKNNLLSLIQDRLSNEKGGVNTAVGVDPLFAHFMSNRSSLTPAPAPLDPELSALAEGKSLPTHLYALNEAENTAALDGMINKGIYTYVQEQWLEGIHEQATRETLQKFNMTQSEFDALPINSPLREEIEKEREDAMLNILAQRMDQANENKILEIIDMRTRLRARVLGQQGISASDFETLPPSRQAELEGMVRKEMLKLQELLRDGYSMTEAFSRLTTA